MNNRRLHAPKPNYAFPLILMLAGGLLAVMLAFLSLPECRPPAALPEARFYAPPPGAWWDI